MNAPVSPKLILSHLTREHVFALVIHFLECSQDLHWNKVDYNAAVACERLSIF